MVFYVIITGAVLLALLLLAFTVWGLLRLAGRRRPGYWRRVLAWQLAALPVTVFVLVPGFLGWMGSRSVHTRRDESQWSGPVLGPGGRWIPQERGRRPPAGKSVLGLTVRTADDVPVHYFDVPKLAGAEPATRRVTAVLVHGLWRGGLELDPVAAMFRRLGCRTVVLELRNHGTSGRSPATLGLREANDVVAVAQRVSRQDRADDPLVLFGVSLGAAAVALAAPRVPGLDGLVLDSPPDALASTAHRVLDVKLGLPWILRAPVLASLELWSDFDLDAVRPVAALQELDPGVRALVIGGGDDDLMPPSVVRRVHDAIPAPADRKALWIREGSGHGKVWSDAPEEYERHLAAFVERLRDR